MWKGKVVDGGQGWLYAGVWFRVLAWLGSRDWR